MKCIRLSVHAFIEGAAGLKQEGECLNFQGSSATPRQVFDTLVLCPFAQFKKSLIFVSKTGKFSG